MSPSHILEPTYQALKERLTGGIWPAGFRLDSARLADDLGVSKSPVRDSLNRLAGERLVDFEPGEGFHVPRLDEKRLHDLLDLNLGLLLAAAQNNLVIPAMEAFGDDPATRAAALFARIGQMSGNRELHSAIMGLNDRLASARHLDIVILSEPEAELDALDAALSAQLDPSAFRDIITRYHAVRKLHVREFVWRLAFGVANHE